MRNPWNRTLWSPFALLIGTGCAWGSPFIVLDPSGRLGDERLSIVYRARSGELEIDIPPVGATSIFLHSNSGIFTGPDYAFPCDVYSFEVCNQSPHEDIARLAGFGESLDSFPRGQVAPAGLSEQFLIHDLRIAGSLVGGGDIGSADLIFVPEPSACVLWITGIITAVGFLKWMNKVVEH